MHPAFRADASTWAEHEMVYPALQPAGRKLCTEDIRAQLTACMAQRVPLYMSSRLSNFDARMVDIAADMQLAHHEKLRKRGESKKSQR